MKASKGVEKLLRDVGYDLETLRLVVEVAEAFARRRRKKSPANR